ncbi:uL30 family ribosomal protein [Candidatus Woesearchaeota archaeon]|nr:uL30 family ribosomal protein [Candidatus Woesearchaeota archaeon]
MSRIAVVRVRGGGRASEKIHDTLRMLNLHAQNSCVVIEDTPAYLGMLRKVKDYVTWGPMSDALFRELVARKGRAYDGRVQDSRGKITYHRWIEVDGKRYYRSFALSPPRKGYGRKGIKQGFGAGGALGDRGKDIQNLLSRMIA